MKKTTVVALRGLLCSGLAAGVGAAPLYAGAFHIAESASPAAVAGASASASDGHAGVRGPTLTSKSFMTSEDYPATAIRKSLQGAVGYRLDVDARGFVTNCTITQSSGHEVLDAATCRIIRRRARFNPAATSTGYPLPGWIVSSLGWWLEGGSRDAPALPKESGAVRSSQLEELVAKELASPAGPTEVKRRWGILSELANSAWYSTQDLSGTVTYYSWKIPGLVMRMEIQSFHNGVAQPAREQFWWYDFQSGKVSHTGSRLVLSPAEDGTVEGLDNQWSHSVSKKGEELIWQSRALSGATSSTQVLRRMPSNAGTSFAAAVVTFDRVVAQPARTEARMRAAAQAQAEAAATAQKQSSGGGGFLKVMQGALAGVYGAGAGGAVGADAAIASAIVGAVGGAAGADSGTIYNSMAQGAAQEKAHQDDLRRKGDEAIAEGVRQGEILRAERERRERELARQERERSAAAQRTQMADASQAQAQQQEAQRRQRAEADATRAAEQRKADDARKAAEAKKLELAKAAEAKRKAAEEERNRPVTWREAVAVCEETGPKSWLCKGPRDSSGAYSTLQGNLNQVCPSGRSLGSQGKYQLYGCGYGINPEDNSPFYEGHHYDWIKALGLVQPPERRTYRCKLQFEYCRSQ